MKVSLRSWSFNINTVIQGLYQSSLACGWILWWSFWQIPLFSVHLASPGFITKQQQLTTHENHSLMGNQTQTTIRLPLTEERKAAVYFPIVTVSNTEVCRLFGGLCVIFFFFCSCFTCFLNRNRPYKKTYHFSMWLNKFLDSVLKTRQAFYTKTLVAS